VTDEPGGVPGGGPGSEPGGGLWGLLPASRGHFRYESGHHGELWLDLDTLLLRPHRLAPYLTQLADRLARHAVDAVCGPLVGGAFVAQFVAARLDVECYYSARSEPGGDALYSAGYRIPDAFRSRLPGRRVAVVDDAINAGSAVRATIEALRGCGAEPTVIGALLVLGSAVTEVAGGLPVEAVARSPNPCWAPADCPLCAAGTPLVD
jgi:orotate phosphoribosyltransferase